jgi:hypothetical protein
MAAVGGGISSASHPRQQTVPRLKDSLLKLLAAKKSLPIVALN